MDTIKIFFKGLFERRTWSSIIRLDTVMIMGILFHIIKVVEL